MPEQNKGSAYRLIESRHVIFDDERFLRAEGLVSIRDNDPH